MEAARGAPCTPPRQQDPRPPGKLFGNGARARTGVIWYIVLGPTQIEIYHADLLSIEPVWLNILTIQKFYETYSPEV